MKNYSSKQFLLLFIILFIGLVFRFYKLGTTPSGLYVDEASMGYNSYSILKTGMDEFGKKFPVMFRSFTTFQSPVYSYLSIPFLALLDMNTFSIRLPSAIFGFLTIPLLYFLVLKLTSKKTAIISALLLAISPWHILYSRTAYETNIALFFLLLGTLFFYYSLKKPWLMLLSAICFSISMLSYRAEMLIVPILVLVLLVNYYKAIKAKLNTYLFPLIISLIVALVLLFPTLKIINTPGFNARTTTLNIFSDSNQKPWGYNDLFKTKPVLNNTKLLSIREFLSLYSSYFSPRYMFSLGDSGPRKPYPDFGTFFSWLFPFYITGLYFLIKNKEDHNLKVLVFTLLLASPIPAALTRDPYSTIRSLPLVIPQVIIIAYGINKFLSFNSQINNYWRQILLICLLIFSSVKLFISIFYFHDYFRSEFWNYGWEEVINTIPSLDPDIPILVDSSRSHPYILFLFFQKYDPKKFQSDNVEVSPEDYYTNMNINPIKKLGRITVKKFDWTNDLDQTEQYIISDGLTISDQQILDHRMTNIKNIFYPDGTLALRITKTNSNTK